MYLKEWQFAGRLPETLALVAGCFPVRRGRDAVVIGCILVVAFANLQGFVVTSADWPDFIRGDNQWEKVAGIGTLIALSTASYLLYASETACSAGRRSLRAMALASVFAVIALSCVAIGDRALRVRTAGTLHDELRLLSRQLTIEEMDGLLSGSLAPDSQEKRQVWEKIGRFEGEGKSNRQFYFMAKRGTEWWFPFTFHRDWHETISDSETHYRSEYPWDSWMLPARGGTFIPPFRDPWGVLVTGAVGVYDAGSRGRLLLCVDMPALDWSTDLLLLRLPSLALVALGGVAGGLWLWARSQKFESDAAELALSSIGHEVRTPLQSLLGYAELVATRPSGDVRDDWNARILSESRHLARVIRAMLDHAALRSGLVELVSAPTSVSAMIHEIAGANDREARAKGLAIRIIISDELPLWLFLDETRLRQVVVNLVCNAIRYTPSGTITLRADWQDDRWLVLSVSDTGVGMSADVQQRLFTPGLRSPEAARTASEGIGLGLSISLRIVRKMGGSITVESAIGKGSVFIVRIPSHCVRPASESNTEFGPADDATILLVEDSRELAEVFAEWVALIGADVHVAGSLGEAEEWLRAGNRATHLLCDHHLPDGFGLAEALQRLPAPIGGWRAAVAITADDTPGLKLEAFGQDWDAILQKPFSPSELARALGFSYITPNDPEKRTGGLFSLPPQKHQEFEKRFLLELPEICTAVESDLAHGRVVAAAQRVHQTRNLCLFLRETQPEIGVNLAKLDRLLQGDFKANCREIGIVLAHLKKQEVGNSSETR
ncbi:hybrid sensor histidine kinase/response regulator [Nibricoccus sp. IMCC34717]|uniref:hybrid sensor histidine kinase/response regulator n=1 Tax=Nibricoccus sp. IMCC34717 TaxID=3034021 RepID=UPI003850A255